jgi:carbon-monoxide dehydrogenase medium subunit
VYPSRFSYARAASPAEALETLSQHGDRASLLAGGMSLVPMMKYRQRAPEVLVDIGRLRELAGIGVGDGVLRIGATTRHHEAAAWNGPESLAVVREVAGRIGDRQVRSMGTVGGGIAAVEPSGDWGPFLLALRGSAVALTPRGRRAIPADELFVDTHRSSLAPDELLEALEAPVPASRFGAAQAKFELRAGVAFMSCVACVELDADERVTKAGVACGGLERVPVRLAEAEGVVEGERLAPDLIDEAAATVRGPSPDFRHIVGARLAADALRLAGARAGVAA